MTTNDTITQEEINRVAWAACDTFRGVLDPSEYKDYVLVFLFLKYISDVWQDHYDTYREQYGDDEERILRKMQRERFILPVIKCRDEDGKVIDSFLANYDSLAERRTADNIGELINITLEAIEDANKDKLEGVFRSIDFNSETKLGRTKDRNRRLTNLIGDFAKLNLRPSRVKEDIIGNAYMYLVERFATESGKKAGEFYTPAQVSHLVARLAKPKSGDRICDPTCGSGTLLVFTGEETHSSNFALFGQEVNGGTWAIARMNMFLHGKDGARIEWADTLNNPLLVENDRLMKFDVVVANPPFSLDKWGAEDAEHDQYGRFWRGVPPKSKGDYAFITHMIETALPKAGRVAVICPHGVLFRGGAEGRIREQLIRENLLDAVISLPEKLFQTTGIPVAILVFDRAREKGGAREDCKDVMFIDASREFEKAKNQNKLTDAHLDKIIATYSARKSVDKYAHVATPDEIEENDFNLNIPRYVDTFEEEEEIDIAEVQREIDALEIELVAVRTKMKQHLKELGIDA